MTDLVILALGQDWEYTFEDVYLQHGEDNGN